MKNKGFSLVELIVVIAIMAILVGVAVPVYTSYIGKAQKSKDIQMVDEVKHALEIYSAANGAGAGWVVLTPDGAIGDEGFGADAMAATFGDDWEEKLALSWDEWKGSSALILSNEDATNLLGSSYLTGSNVQELLGDVTELTDAALGMIGTFADDPAGLYRKIEQFFPEMLDGFNQYFDTEVVEGETQFTYDPTDADEFAEFQTQLSNYLVIAVAEKMSDYNPSDYDPEGENDELAVLMGQFATANAFANSEYAKNDPAIGEAYEELMGVITGPGANTNTVGDALATFLDFENATYKEAILAYTGEGGTAASDFEAFKKMMQTVTSLHSNGNITKDDISNPDLYSNGTIAQYFDSYVAAANLAASLTDEQIDQLKAALDVNSSSVAVYISNGKTGCTENEIYGE